MGAKIIKDDDCKYMQPFLMHQFLLGVDLINRSSSSLYDTTDWIIANPFANQPDLVKSVLNAQQEAEVWYMRKGRSKVFPH